MHNFFKQWKAILPLAIALTFIGLIAGIFYGATRTQSYSVTQEVLVIGAADTVLPEDLFAIANSPSLVGDVAKKNANVDNSCGYKAAKSGNVVRITTTCESSADDSRKLAESVSAQFSEAIKSVYENDAITVKSISQGEAVELITTTNRVIYVVVAALAGLAASAFIAFVKLDHLTSKNNK